MGGSMVRKRQLTAELWCDDMRKQAEQRERMNKLDFYRAHEALGHSMMDVIYEMQMAEHWRNAGMQVYDFDPEFTASIACEKWDELLPHCVQNRPHDCFYMKLPCERLNEGAVVSIVDTRNIVGFDIGLFPGADQSKGVYYGGDPRFPEFGERALVNTGDELLALMHFAVPVEHGLMFDDTQMKRYTPDLVANGVAYICSTNADIVPSYKPQQGIRRNNAKKRSAATWHDVGYRVGAELRAYERAKSERKPHQGGTVRPHMRRAHWHHYWTGPRDGERELVLRWIAPTMVGVGDIESATGHRIAG